ncbi:MAG: CapA family protein [Candidatus Bathyarchaeota archaeon]|nr:CapA family protein [Candidatus Bathyarchaeum tardum]
MWRRCYIGYHPHVIQGIENYAKGIIVYSLGNF